MNDFWKIKDWVKRQIKKRSRTDFFIMLLFGVLMMVVAVPTGTKKEAKTVGQEAVSQQSAREESLAGVSPEVYKNNLERQLKELLTKMDGAGKCEVMITLRDNGFTRLDKNRTSGERSKEESSVVYRGKTEDAPYIILREYPQVEGVVVVSEGGGNPGVVEEISNAVMSLFRIEAHKITVVKMSVQEE